MILLAPFAFLIVCLITYAPHFVGDCIPVLGIAVIGKVLLYAFK